MGDNEGMRPRAAHAAGPLPEKARTHASMPTRLDLRASEADFMWLSGWAWGLLFCFVGEMGRRAIVPSLASCAREDVCESPAELCIG